MNSNDGSTEFKGDANLFSDLYEQKAAGLIVFANNLVGSRTDAEDVVSEAFAKLWMKTREPGHHIQNPESYLYLMVRNSCFDIIRRRKFISQKIAEILRLQESEIDEDYIRDQILGEIVQHFRVQVNHLPPIYRDVFDLLVQGHNNEEIALITGKSNKMISKIKGQMKKALKISLPASPGVVIAILLYWIVR